MAHSSSPPNLSGNPTPPPPPPPRPEGLDALRFRKLCRDSGLTGRGFRSADAEAAFASVQRTEVQR